MKKHYQTPPAKKGTLLDERIRLHNVEKVICRGSGTISTSLRSNLGRALAEAKAKYGGDATYLVGGRTGNKRSMGFQWAVVILKPQPCSQQN